MWGYPISIFDINAAHDALQLHVTRITAACGTLCLRVARLEPLERITALPLDALQPRVTHYGCVGCIMPYRTA